MANRARPSRETLKGLITDFQASADFEKLRPKTRKDYARYLGLIGRGVLVDRPADRNGHTNEQRTRRVKRRP